MPNLTNSKEPEPGVFGSLEQEPEPLEEKNQEPDTQYGYGSASGQMIRIRPDPQLWLIILIKFMITVFVDYINGIVDVYNVDGMIGIDNIIYVVVVDNSILDPYHVDGMIGLVGGCHRVPVWRLVRLRPNQQ